MKIFHQEPRKRWRRSVCQTLLKVLDISIATARVAPALLKALAILSDTTVRRSPVDQEDLKPYLKSEKRPHFSRWSTILLFKSFSKTLLTMWLAELFNKSQKESFIPDCWKVSSVIHVFKNVGERSTAKNYHPVSLLFVQKED